MNGERIITMRDFECGAQYFCDKIKSRVGVLGRYSGHDICELADNIMERLVTPDDSKEGYWHDIYLLTPWVATGICSHCNTKSYINPDFPYADYCPNCGYHMSDGNKPREMS